MSKLITPNMATDDLFALSGMAVMNDGDEYDSETSEDNGEFIFFPPFEFSINTDDIDEQETEVTALENSIIDLMYLTETITNASGMNQSFAMEAEKLVPGIVGAPIGYFTKDTTATRYKASLESISDTIWKFLGRLVAKLIESILKIYSFFSGDEKDSSKKKAEDKLKDSIKKAEEAPDILKKSGAVMDKFESALKGTNIVITDDNDVEFKCDSFTIAVEKLFKDDYKYANAKKFLESKDPIFHDILNHGPYSKAIVSSGLLMVNFERYMVDRITLLKKVIAANKGSSSSTSDMLAESLIKTIDKELLVSMNGKEYTLDELNSYLHNTRQSVLDHSNDKKINVDQLFNTMVNAYSNIDIAKTLKAAADTLPIFTELENEMEICKSNVHDLSMDGSRGTVSSNVGAMIRQVLYSISKNINSYQKIYTQIKGYSDAMEY